MRFLACFVLAALVAGCTESATLAPLPSPALDVSAPPSSPVVSVSALAPPSQPGQYPARTKWACENARPWKYIVIHHSGNDRGSAAAFDRAHRNRGFDEMGYHFVITNGNGGQDGHIEVGSRWRSQKWGAHTGGTPGNEYNNYGIGICLVGNFNERSPTQTQIASLHQLVTELADTYNIAPSNVIDHRDAPNATTTCPGDRLHAYVYSVLRPELLRLASADQPAGNLSVH